MLKACRLIYATAALTFMLCVTGLALSGEAQAQQCVDNGDGTVTHKTTGLMWQKDTGGPMNWDEAMSYASALSLGGHSGWRLAERRTLEDMFYSPCRKIINSVGDFYWSATLKPSDPNQAGVVHFGKGRTGFSIMSASYYVHAVRYVE